MATPILTYSPAGAEFQTVSPVTITPSTAEDEDVSSPSPILAYAPGYGGPIVAVSPSNAGVTQLINGQSYIDVVFGSTRANTDWMLVECSVINTFDSDPLNIWPGIISSRTTTGFRLQLNGSPDTSNYYLRWAISGEAIPPGPATSYFLSGPGSGPIDTPLTFVVSLPTGGTIPATITVTPSDGGGGGTFIPTSVELSTDEPAASFTYTTPTYGLKAISVTNDGFLTNPASIVFTPVGDTYLLSGPSTGDISTSSTPFTVELLPGAVVSGTVTVIPNDGGGGGTFTPSIATLTTAAPSDTFTYTPASVGTKTISCTNNGGLTNPDNLTYISTSPAHLLDTLIGYWTLDEASGTRNDSHGTNHLTPTNAPAGSAGLINNGALFVAASAQYLSHVSNTDLQVTGDFTFSLWVKLTSTVDMGLIAKQTSGTGTDYLLTHSATGGFGFSGSNPSSGLDIAQVGSPAANGVWIHLIVWYDSSVSKAKIRVNDTTTYQSTSSGPLAQTAVPFYIGSTPSVPFHSNAVIDEVGFWKRKLTAFEMTALYNGGTGLPYSSFVA